MSKRSVILTNNCLLEGNNIENPLVCQFTGKIIGLNFELADGFGRFLVTVLISRVVVVFVVQIRGDVVRVEEVLVEDDRLAWTGLVCRTVVSFLRLIEVEVIVQVLAVLTQEERAVVDLESLDLFFLKKTTMLHRTLKQAPGFLRPARARKRCRSPRRHLPPSARG